MAQLIAKLVGYFAEHIIVAGLSRSKRFQSLALWIDHHITHNKKIVEDHTKSMTEKADGFAKSFKKALEEETKAAVEASKVQSQNSQMKSQSATTNGSKTQATPSGSSSSSTASGPSSTNSSSSGGYSGGRYTNSPSNRVDRIR
mmetsp:Transcript_23076/g.17496  ORF Transcript_23076/g.17496 Transcript_23076/m.17496 type:complete len:144 (+) Transcript_23076:61-492(+)